MPSKHEIYSGFENFTTEREFLENRKKIAYIVSISKHEESISQC